MSAWGYGWCFAWSVCAWLFGGYLYVNRVKQWKIPVLIECGMWIALGYAAGWVSYAFARGVLAVLQ